MQPCSGLNWIKGRARHIPTQTDTVARFALEHVVLFLCLCYLVSKERHKGYYVSLRSLIIDIYRFFN